MPVAQRNAVAKKDAPTVVDPVKRYLHYEKAYLDGELDPAFKDLTGLTRKFSIPLLEHFDKIKLTIRIDDKRVLRKG